MTTSLSSTTETKQSEIENAFRSFTAREDIAVLLITQTVTLFLFANLCVPDC